MWFLSQSCRAMKSLSSHQSLLKGGRLKKYTEKNIAQATKTASSAESMRHFVELCICLIPPKVLFWAKIWVNGWLFESGNPVICADGAASAFSSVKLLSISQLCVKVLLNKNAQNIYQVDTNFQINFFGKHGLKRSCQTRKCDPPNVNEYKITDSNTWSLHFRACISWLKSGFNEGIKFWMWVR